MKTIFRLFKRLWVLGTCDHWNMGRQIDWDDTTSLRVCKRCGLVMQIVLADKDRASFTKAAQ